MIWSGVKWRNLTDERMVDLNWMNYDWIRNKIYVEEKK